jgi:hypothetical protein
MKEVDKKEAPDVAGGYVGPLADDLPGRGDPFPKFPTTPIDVSDDSPTTWR